MARGGLRVGAGRPKKEAALNAALPVEIKRAARASHMKPLEYMLAVMNDEEVDPQRRDRMAVAAAPYVHPKAEEVGKKEQRLQNAQEIGAQRFATPATPMQLVSKAA